MKGPRSPAVAIASLLAVLIPLGQAHCLTMGFEGSTSKVGARQATHGCCTPSAPTQPKHNPKTSDCACFQLPPSSLPQVDTSVHVLSASPLAAIDPASVIVPDTILLSPTTLLDVGIPSFPIDFGAHGLRAPPRSA